MAEVQREKQTGAENVSWDLSIYYERIDDPRIDQDLAKIERHVAEFVAQYRGQVASLNAAGFKAAYEKLENIYNAFYAVAEFAQLNFSVYSDDPQWGAFLQKVTEKSAAIDQQLIFFDLEWNQLQDAAAQRILTDPAVEPYRYLLEVARKRKPYQLSEAEEKLLIEKSVTGRSAWIRLFNQIDSTLMVTYEGEAIPKEEVLAKMYAPDREVRRKAADAMTAALQSRKMELSYIFNVLTADKAADDRLRGYATWLTDRNLSNKVSDATVNALIETVTANYDLVARHYRIKKLLMGHDELFDYDRYAPLNLKESDTFYTWDKARQIVLDAYGSFAPQMGAIAGYFFDRNWIHPPVKMGKQGGAYASQGTKTSHPWVFLNYTGNANDVMTLAHELGHGIHMYLSAQHQTLFGMYTPLTTAEMASVFGEMVVFQDLMRKENDDEIKLSLLSKKIDSMFATVYRQTAMNRFEEQLHTARRSEGELSIERLSQIWMETQQAMFAGSITLRDEYAIWWSYIWHFVGAPGYVYAYAFGELLVLALYNRYQETGADFVPKYIELLSAGDSDYPENLLAKIGVNLNDPHFWQQGIDAIRKLIDWEAELAKQLFPDKF